MADVHVERLRTALQESEVRIEFGFSFISGENKTGVVPCAQLYKKTEGGRWVKVPHLPLILPPEGGNRADLLRLFADLFTGEVS